MRPTRNRVNIMENKHIKLTFKTHEPTFMQKLTQMYWVNPKSWLLNEFTIDDNMLTVSTLKGNQIIAPIDELTIRVQTDNYDRKEVYVKWNNEKLHFKEMPGMLDDDDWEKLFEILLAFPNNGRTTLDKIQGVLKSIIDMTE